MRWKSTLYFSTQQRFCAYLGCLVSWVNKPDDLPSVPILNCPLQQLTAKAPFFTLGTEFSACTQQQWKYCWVINGAFFWLLSSVSVYTCSFLCFFLSSPPHRQASPKVWFSLHSSSRTNFLELSHPLPNL